MIITHYTTPLASLERLISTYDGELKEPVPSEQLMTLQPLFEDIGEEAGDESPQPQEEEVTQEEIEEYLGDLSEEEAKLLSTVRESTRIKRFTFMFFLLPSKREK